MIKVNLICVGTIKEKYLKDNIDEYLKRLSRFLNVNIIEIKEEKIQEYSKEEDVKEKESENILKKLDKKDEVILIDLHGDEIDSLEFANIIKNYENSGKSPLSFVIAGTLGFSKTLINKANKRISLSKLTFPHQLTRLIFLEQLYRAEKINHNEAYHH